MQKIGGASERNDDPHEFMLAAAARVLGQNRVLRVAAANRRDDVRFRRAVDIRDEIIAAFAVDLQGIEAREALYDQIAGAPRGAHGDIEEGLHKVALEYHQ